MAMKLTGKGSLTVSVDKKLVRYERGVEYEDKDVAKLPKECQAYFTSTAPKKAEGKEETK